MASSNAGLTPMRGSPSRGARLMGDGSRPVPICSKSGMSPLRAAARGRAAGRRLRLRVRGVERRVLAFIVVRFEVWPVHVVEREDAMQRIDRSAVILELHVSFVSVNVA